MVMWKIIQFLCIVQESNDTGDDNTQDDDDRGDGNRDIPYSNNQYILPTG